MRHLKLVDSNKYQLITKIFEFTQHASSQNHKLTVIKSILDHAPSTQEFIMVGDSGEVDPEVKLHK
jgi:phosphatidate phosphatase APP1